MVQVEAGQVPHLELGAVGPGLDRGVDQPAGQLGITVVVDADLGDHQGGRALTEDVVADAQLGALDPLVEPGQQRRHRRVAGVQRSDAHPATLLPRCQSTIRRSPSSSRIDSATPSSRRARMVDGT